MDNSPPESSVHGIFQARILERDAMPFQGIFPTLESNLHLLHLLHWQADSLPLVPSGKATRWLLEIKMFERKGSRGRSWIMVQAWYRLVQSSENLWRWDRPSEGSPSQIKQQAFTPLCPLVIGCGFPWKSMTFHKAAFCRGRDPDGTDSWRLPADSIPHS